MQIPETGNYTVMIVTPVWNPAGSSGAYHNHPVGLYYDGSAWWVYNEDQATMPSDVAFAVRVASASDDAYIHVSSASNTHGDYTILDRPSLNGHPEAMVFVTHVYDTPSVPTALHNHPVGVWYTGSNWAVFNEDLAPMPTGVVFNVMVAPPAQ